MIVTIDGPAGAGKSTVARRLAKRLGFAYLDTGAMYRAVAWIGLRRGIDWNDDEAVGWLAARTSIQWNGDRILVNGEDVSDAIRTTEITAAVGHAADHPAVRRWLVQLQRAVAEGVSLVTEGRDQGSVAFPDAACKIFLVARPEERARRRVEDFHARGEEVEFEKVLADILQRDRADQSRPVGALVKPDGAICLATDGLTIEQVVDRLEEIARKRGIGS
ncbi:MAG: (d)CMP kinase [Planctomycetaceae bacterium]|nr:(d)CMP kinase [Planctomycetaceae bacterium]